VKDFSSHIVTDITGTRNGTTDSISVICTVFHT
jgi:hypothetical protein